MWASATKLVEDPEASPPRDQHNMVLSTKQLAETPGLTSIPPTYNFNRDPNEEPISDEFEDSNPVIDFSLLASRTPHDQRSKIVHDLGKACQDWGCFMVINHGVPESLMKAMVEACGEFFNLAEEEKQEFAGKHVLDSLRCGPSINGSTDHVFFWRDYLKFFAHPSFHSPSKPTRFREIALEYSTRTRKVAMELVKAISASLGLEEGYIEKALNMELGLQIFISNFYPPCPQPELAMGLPPHSDHALLTLLINNGISGLQLQRQGKWVNINSIPNAFMVIFGDQMEIMSNGKYECAVHRATVNGKATRMSIAMLFGPALETVVGPAPELVDNETNPPVFTAMKYKEYLEQQQSRKIIGKCALDRVRILSV